MNTSTISLIKSRFFLLSCLLFLLSFSTNIHAQKIKNLGKDIGKTVKKVGKDVGKTAKHVGKDVGKTAKHVGKDVGKTAKQVGKDVGKTAKHLGKDVGQIVKKLRQQNTFKKTKLSQSISKSEKTVIKSHQKIASARKQLEIDKKNLSAADYKIRLAKINAAEKKTKQLEKSISKGKLKIK